MDQVVRRRNLYRVVYMVFCITLQGSDRLLQTCALPTKYAQSLATMIPVCS